MSSPQSSEENIDSLFFCRIDNARIISNLLSAVHFGKNQYATVMIHKKGIKVTVEEGKELQASVFMQEDLFQEFTIKEEIIRFRILLHILIEALNIFSSSATSSQAQFSSTSLTSMRMMYSRYGDPLFLVLNEGETVTDVGLRTLEIEELLNINFRSVPIFNKVIMKSEGVREAFNELDWSSTFVTLLLSPDPPYFRLTTSGPSGSCQVDYPRDSEVFEKFECQQTQSNNYKLKFLQPSIKALQHAEKTQMRVNQTGILNLQHMIRTEDKNTCFADFFIFPTVDADDETNDPNPNFGD